MSTVQPAPTADEGYLRGLLEVGSLLDREPDPVRSLPAIAEIVARTLPFSCVCILLGDPAAVRPRLAAGVGCATSGPAPLETTDTPGPGWVDGSGRPPAEIDWAEVLAPERRRRGVYLIGEEVLEPDTIAWVAPLDAPGGHRHGLLWLADPGELEQGRIPVAEERALEVAAALGCAVGRALQDAERESELTIARARKRALIESSPDPVVAIDREGRVLEFNRAAEETFGFSSREAVGRDLAQLIIPPEHREAHRMGLQRARRNEWRLLGRRIETVGLRADGTRLPVELTLAPVHDPGQEAPFVYGFVRDISDRRHSEEQLAFLAYHDPLTGLPNRVLVEQQLDLAIARARRRAGAVAVMFVDLDDFKEINDRFGHQAGDRLLREVTIRLRSVLRDSDLLARQGGDEFIVLLADIAEDPHAAAEMVGAKLLTALRDPFAIEGTEAHTGASIGVSIYPDDSHHTEGLLRNADVAMYQAKGQGGGRIAFHEVTGEVRSRRRGVSDQLREAVRRHELELHYQTIWELSEEPVIWGVEALLRWRHPDRGLLAPDAFLSMAQHSAAGDEVLDWIASELCRQGQAWRKAGLEPTLGLNVSPQQLQVPGFAARLLERLADHDLPAQQLMIELSESAWSIQSPEALGVIGRLRSGGTRLAIDEFGAGYSSLARLRELGIDVIKVDRRLLAGLLEDPTALALLQAVVAVAGACQATVIAHGVESEAQLARLRDCGIGLAQGFLLGRPAEAAPTTERLRASRTPGRRSDRPHC